MSAMHSSAAATAIAATAPRRLPLSPGRRLVHALSVLAALALVAAVGAKLMPSVQLIWLGLAGLLGVVVLTDGWIALRTAPADVLTARRVLPHALALGVAKKLAIKVANSGPRELAMTVHDHAPALLNVKALPANIRIPANSETTLWYEVTPVERGPAQFGRVEVLVDSPWGFWRRRRWLAAPTTIRVYPNFAAVARFALLATDHRLSRLGVKLKRRRGEGMEFHQLREYRQGDSLRQIDWKATTRQRKLISRDYQDERDQRLMFLLDSSRRMRAQDGEYSHFDQALNSLMLLAHVALKQGDSVGALSFGQPAGGDRFFSPEKGGAALNQLTNALYDLQPQPRTGDYLEAAKALMARVPKRSMVVILTNLRDEDEDELQLAIRVLAAKHLVVLASLREAALDAVLEREVKTFDDALDVASAQHYLDARERTFAKLVKKETFALDVPPAMLPIALVNQYLEIKRSGRL
ncbi:MAG: DUF58 domain-containing protein [Burkholderiales bacterium]|nr:DUF58 domain-containing protein [Burkholderiales bacterium]